MTNKRINLVLVILFLVFTFNATAQNPTKDYSSFRFPRTQWHNVDSAYTISQFKNNTAILFYFWNNNDPKSLSELEKIKRIEKNFDKLTVLAVHQPEFPIERDSVFLRKSIAKLNIQFPVINDLNHTISQYFEADFYPSIILLSPSLKLASKGNETINELEISNIIQNAIRDHEVNHRSLWPHPTYSFEKNQETYSLLSHPQAICSDATSGNLYISDTGHNRIIFCKKDGQVINFAGNGKRGYIDGDILQVEFNSPIDLAYDNMGDILYVLDYNNHVIRSVNFNESKVTTLFDFSKNSIAPAINTALNTPKAIKFSNGNLYWHDYLLNLNILDPTTMEYSQVIVKKDSANQSTLKSSISFAINSKNNYLYNTQNPSNIFSVIGATNTKVIFPDSLSPQSIRSCEANNNKYYSLDYYSNKLYVIDPEYVTLTDIIEINDTSIIGPNDLTFIDNNIYIANTLNNTIEIFNLDNQNITPFTLTNLNRLFPIPGQKERASIIDTIIIHPTRQTNIELNIIPPPNYAVYSDAENYIMCNDRTEVIFDNKNNLSNSIKMSVFPKDIKHTLNLSGTIHYCHVKKPNDCYRKEYGFILPIKISKKTESTKKVILNINR